MEGKRGHQQGSGIGQVNMPDSSSKPRSLTGHESSGTEMELKDKGPSVCGYQIGGARYVCS